MEIVNFKFIIDDHESKTTKERELRIAEARAHAARVSHQRKNAVSRCTRAAPLRGNGAVLIGGTATGTGTGSDDSPQDGNEFLSKSIRGLLGAGRVDPF